MRTTVLAVALALCLEAPWAWAQGTIAWYFDNTNFVVLPSDQILVTATVTNLSATPFKFDGIAGNFSGDLQKHYDFTPQQDLFGKTVPGYGALEFAFGTLTPVGGAVPLGTYYADPAAFNFGLGLQYSENTFDITVVPEPTLLGLGGVGVAWLWTRRWRRKTGGRLQSTPPPCRPPPRKPATGC